VSVVRLSRLDKRFVMPRVVAIRLSGPLKLRKPADRVSVAEKAIRVRLKGPNP
jgi:hypothetical protein